MINSNGQLLELLKPDPYYLLHILQNYGDISCPSNDVLEYKTGWGINKLQNAKKVLKDMGLIEVTKRFKIENGRSVRDTNQYRITTNLCSKYNGKKSQLHDFNAIEIQLPGFDVVEIQLHDFEVLQNEVGIKVLKLLSIEKLNKLKSVLIEDELEKLKKEILESGIKEKSSVKKEKRIFPDITAKKSYKVNKTTPLDVNMLRPYQIATGSYKFLDKGWTESLKDKFLLYCKVKDENHKFGAAQVMLRVKEVQSAIPKYPMDKIESLLTKAANGAWASFDFDDRIEEKKKRYNGNTPSKDELDPYSEDEDEKYRAKYS